MKLKVITLTDNPKHPGFNWLKMSLDHFRYDWHCIEVPWRGFGTKIIETAKYVETIKDEYTHFIFLDAHDSFALRPFSEFLERFPNPINTVSTEKACWPDPSLAEPFDKMSDSPWRYLNSGHYLMSISDFIEICQNYPIDYRDDDQLWLTKVFLSGNLPLSKNNRFLGEISFSKVCNHFLHLDTKCVIFQSMAFEAPDDFIYHRYEIENTKTPSIPFFFHFNGKTKNERAYQILKNCIK